jgi:hypothetical protein
MSLSNDRERTGATESERERPVSDGTEGNERKGGIVSALASFLVVHARSRSLTVAHGRYWPFPIV